MSWRPEVRGEGLGSHSGFTGCLGSQFLGGEEAVEAVEDAGQTYSFSPKGGGDGVDGTQLWNQDLKTQDTLVREEVLTYRNTKKMM